jgi:hypothetical protein
MTDTSLDAFPDRSVAMVRAFSPALQRALLVSGAIAIVVAILGTPLVADRVPFPIGPVVVAGLGTLVGIAAGYLSVPADLRRAYEAYSWLGRTETERFKARTGGPVPVDPNEIDRWLASTPSTSATRMARIEMLAFVGRHDDARRELDGLAPVSPEDRFEAASLRQYLDWLETGVSDTSELASTAAVLPAGSIARRMAEVTLALADARVGFVQRDRTWSTPLRDVRPSLGGAAAIVVFRDTWLKFAGLSFVAAAGVGLLVLLLR